MRRSAILGATLSAILAGSLAMAASAQDEMSAIDPCTSDAVPVTGKIIWKGLEHDPTVFESDGSQHVRDFVFLSRMKASDPRLVGDTTATIDWDFYGLDGKPPRRAGVNRGSFRVAGPEGDWVGPWTGTGTATDAWRAVVELTGEGAYEGFSATLFTRSGESGPVAGVIYPTELASCDVAAVQ